MADGEHLFEERLIDASYKGRQDTFIDQGPVVGSAQGLALTFATNKSDFFTVAQDQFATDAELGVGMPETVGRADRNPEKHAAQGSQGSAFAGFIGAVDQMKGARVIGEIQRSAGKRTEGDKLQRLYFHAASVSLFSPLVSMA
jgi:hypothetical protein